MVEKSSQITHEIEETRTRLGWNLQELEDTVKRLADWCQQFERRSFSHDGCGSLRCHVTGEHRRGPASLSALGSALQRVLQPGLSSAWRFPK